MGKRSDAKRTNELSERICWIVFDRLTSDEFRELIALSDSGGISRAETLAKFYTSQYSIVCREMMEFAERHKSENLFKRREIDFYNQAFLVAVGTVYDDDIAQRAIQMARLQSSEGAESPNGTVDPGPLLHSGSGALLDLGTKMELKVEIHAHERSCVITPRGSRVPVEQFEWSEVHEFLAHEEDPSNLLVHFRYNRALSVSAFEWVDIFVDRGLAFRPLGE